MSEPPSIPSSRPNRQMSESSESSIPTIPSHRPKPVSSETASVNSDTHLPSIPTSRPKSGNTATPSASNASSKLNLSLSNDEIETPVIPSSRPSKSSNNNQDNLSETIPGIPKSRPSPIVAHNGDEIEFNQTAESVKGEEQTNQNVDKNEEQEADDISLNDSLHNDEVSIENSDLKYINNSNSLKKTEKNAILETTDDDVENQNTKETEIETEKEEEEAKKDSAEPLLEGKNDDFDDKQSNEIETSSNENRIESLPISKEKHLKVKDALDELDLLENEIELTSKEIANLPTEDSQLGVSESVIQTGEKEENATEIPKITQTDESVSDSPVDIPPTPKNRPASNVSESKVEGESICPIIPKSRPSTDSKSKEVSEEPMIPVSRPKTSFNEPTTDLAERIELVSHKSLDLDTPSKPLIHKKPPPKVPKKPSSRIAQFQEMLEQQQKVDLGIFENKMKPKPPTKRPTVHYEVKMEDDEKGENEDNNEDEKTEAEADDTKPKVNKLNSRFTQNLNGMIGMALPGMALPGMAFGGNPIAALKSSKEAESNGETEESEGNGDKVVKDVRRGRARGPRGRKLPGEVKKVVEINDETLGNKFDIVVKQLWSVDFNLPLKEEQEGKEDEKEIEEEDHKEEGDKEEDEVEEDKEKPEQLEESNIEEVKIDNSEIGEPAIQSDVESDSSEEEVEKAEIKEPAAVPQDADESTECAAVEPTPEANLIDEPETSSESEPDADTDADAV